MPNHASSHLEELVKSQLPVILNLFQDSCELAWPLLISIRDPETSSGRRYAPVQDDEGSGAV